MIARLVGRLVHKSPGSVIVDAHGVGYQVMVSLNTFGALPRQGDEVTLQIHTHLRENALELFGFGDLTEKALFELLLTVSGVGPRVALGVLSGIPPAVLLSALAAGDSARLMTVPGIGKKTAERLVVELQDRARRLREQLPVGERPGDLELEAASALVNLGYRHADAERAVRQVLDKSNGDLATVIRQALQRLSG
jgi:Holliday junction DNA helicase RuvA